MKHNIKQFIILALMLVGNITAWADETVTFTFKRVHVTPIYNSYLVYNNTDYKLNAENTNWFTTASTTAGGVTVTIDYSPSASGAVVEMSSSLKAYADGYRYQLNWECPFTLSFSASKYISHVKVYCTGVDYNWESDADNNTKSCSVRCNQSGNVSWYVYKVDVTLSDTKPLLDIANATVAHNITDSYDYTGSAITPAITGVTFNTGSFSLGMLTLTEGIDYTVGYENNTNAGTATMTLTGKGDYTGTWSKTFAINKVAPTVTVPEPVTTGYNGTTQALCSAGAVTGGTLMYSIDGGLTWSADVPTAIHAASYNVNYRVIADQNHIDVAPTLAGTATINSRQQTFGTVTVTDGYANSANNTIVISDGTDKVTIAEHVPGIGSVTMERTFTPGTAATMMLPFDIDISKVSGGTFYGYIGVDKNGTEWDVVMQEVNRVSGTLQAHTPYLFMPTAEHITFNLGGTTVTLKANSQQTYTVEP